MKKLVLVFFFLSEMAFGQNQNSVWVFGDSAGIDFSSGAPVTFASGMDGRGSCVSIADTNGNLLFYAFSRAGMGYKSTLIFDATHQMMQNGDSINGEAWYRELLIVPSQNNIYYFFSKSMASSSLDGLYYSIIDMNMNGGLGAVTQKNIQLNNFRNGDCITAIKHGNGRDWWLITKNSNLTMSNKFFKYLITPNGIDFPLTQTFNNATNMDNQRIVFNSTGEKFMQLNVFGFLAEYDFDRCTGDISNPNIIFLDLNGFITRYFWDGAYSGNDSKFYIAVSWLDSQISDTSRVLQYDLTAANIPLSCDTLFTIKHPIDGGSIRLAPDGKIYYTSAYYWGGLLYPYPDSVYNQYNMNLGVVNYPDSAGAACDFQPFSFYLGGKRTYWGLPNNPNYSLGPLAGSACDTLTSPTPVLPGGEGGPALFAFYHPGWQKLFVNAQHLKGKNCLLQIFDVNGKIVFSYEKKTQPPYFTEDVNCTAFAKGMYIVSLQTEKEKLVKKFILH